MLTKFKDSNDMNTIASDAIHSYIKDGYRIDAKESVIDRDKDKDCTFKAVLKKDVDGIECKTVITLTDNGDDKIKSCTYHKVETVGDTKWSEETRTFKSSTSETKCNDEDDWLKDHRKRMKRISDKYGFGWDWFEDNIDDRFKRLTDVIKTTKESVDDTELKCKRPSTYDRLDDYVKLNDKDKDDHIKIDAKDSVDDIYNKIVNRKKNLEDAVNKARAKEEKVETKPVDDDDVEDSLIKLVRYIFGK